MARDGLQSYKLYKSIFYKLNETNITNWMSDWEASIWRSARYILLYSKIGRTSYILLCKTLYLCITRSDKWLYGILHELVCSIAHVSSHIIVKGRSCIVFDSSPYNCLATPPTHMFRTIWWDLFLKGHAVWSRYNAVKYNIIFHTAMQWQT